MNADRDATETEFVRRLRNELRAIVAERGLEAEAAGQGEASRPRALDAWRRRGPRVAVAGALLVAVVVAVLIASAGGGDTSAAWAVKPAAGGRVSVVIRDLDDAKGLEGALRQAGLAVSVTYRSSASFEPCHRSAEGAPVGVGISRSMRGPTRFTVDPDALAPGRKIHLTASPDLVFIGFTSRAGHDDAEAIETKPAALFECITHDPREPLTVPLPPGRRGE